MHTVHSRGGMKVTLDDVSCYSSNYIQEDSDNDNEEEVRIEIQQAQDCVTRLGDHENLALSF